MPFLLPSLLIGLLAAAVPVVIHLLHRQRTRPVRWGAMQFLLGSPLRTRRRKRVENWLLLLARMAALALLAFLLARPVLSAAGFNPLAGGIATDVAVVIDRSLSMGRRATGTEDNSPTAFAQSLAALDRLAGSMRPNDTLSVVLAEHQPNALTPFPVTRGNVTKLRQELERLGPGTTDASIPDAIAVARDVIAKGRNARKMVVVVSDEQRVNWQIDNHAAWSMALGRRQRPGDGGVALYTVPVAVERETSDVAIGELRITPGVVGAGRPAQVIATVTNAGPKDVPAVRVSLSVGETATKSQDIPLLPAGQTHTVQFDHTFTQPGSQWVRVRADVNDALAANNEAVAAVNVRDRLPVLVIDGAFTDVGGFPASQFLRLALQPVDDEAKEATSLVQPKVIGLRDAESAKLDDYPVVIVNDVPQLPPTALDRLAAYARAGNALWFILGPRSNKEFITRDLARAGLFTADVKELKEVNAAEPAPVVEVRDTAHPTVALIADAQRNTLIGADTRQWWSLNVRDDDRAVILSTAGGDPLVIERPVGRNGGRVMVWATSADRKWNNWPTMPNFVPLVNETLFHLAASRTRGQENRRLEAGEPIEWTAPARPPVQRAEITRPDGTKAEAYPTLSNGRHVLRYADTALPGLYTIRFTPTDIPQPVYYGVGLDRREMDNTPLSEADLKWLQDRGHLAPEARIPPDQLAAAVGAGGRTGTSELWPLLAVALLGLLVFETFMTWRMARHQQAEVVAA